MKTNSAQKSFEQHIINIFPVKEIIEAYST